MLHGIQCQVVGRVHTSGIKTLQDLAEGSIVSLVASTMKAVPLASKIRPICCPVLST